MMGEKEQQSPPWNYRVNLDKRVRRDHPLRRINEVLDSSFVRAQVTHTYGRRGNKSSIFTTLQSINRPARRSRLE
jgi:transposase